MKKIVAMVLVIASLFTLSSSVLCCGAEENSKAPEIESTSDLITTVDKEITKEEKVEKFLSEKKNYFPKDKISEIKSILENVSDNELNIVLSLKFDNPSSMEFISLSAGGLGLDRFKFGDTGMGVLKIILSVLSLGSLGVLYTCDNVTATFSTLTKRLTCMAALITNFANLSVALYDAFTVPCRVRQTNYEYLLKIIGQK